MPQNIQNHRHQTIISYLIIAILILIAGAVGFKQKNYQKTGLDAFDEPAKVQTVLSDELFANFDGEKAEIYDSKNLYEKIDGKADLYLNNGFVSLQCRRFVSKTDKTAWAEVYLYDMDKGENAFSVYGLQKRSESTPLNWVKFGYSTGDSVYAAFGKYYMEIVLSSENDSLLTAAQNGGRKLSQIAGGGETKFSVFTLFPTENLVSDSFTSINADAFGCSDLKNIFTAEYKINQSSITAYLSGSNPGETFEKYYRFLIDNGGKDLPNVKIPGARAVELYGTNEIIFVKGDYFAGVRGIAKIEDMQIAAEKFIESLNKQK